MNLDLQDYEESAGKYSPDYLQMCREYEEWLNSEAFKKSLDEQEAARG
jgi:hypothetical protein